MNFWLKHGHPVSAEAFYCPLSTHITVEPWYNKHLYNERDSKIYEKGPWYDKTLLQPLPFFISKFHCNRIQLCDDFLFTLLYSLAGYETHEEHKSGKSTILFHKNTTSVLITAVLQRPQQRNKHTKQSIALFLLDNKKAIILHSSGMLPCKQCFLQAGYEVSQPGETTARKVQECKHMVNYSLFKDMCMKAITLLNNNYSCMHCTDFVRYCKLCSNAWVFIIKIYVLPSY